MLSFRDSRTLSKLYVAACNLAILCEPEGFIKLKSGTVCLLSKKKIDPETGIPRFENNLNKQSLENI